MLHLNPRPPQVENSHSRVMVDSLFGELTVLGFLGLVTFVIGKTPLLEVTLLAIIECVTMPLIWNCFAVGESQTLGDTFRHSELR